MESRGAQLKAVLFELSEYTLSTLGIKASLLLEAESLRRSLNICVEVPLNTQEPGSSC